MNKVLIIAAHPDDDILGCAGLMSKYRNQVFDLEQSFLQLAKRRFVMVAQERHSGKK